MRGPPGVHRLVGPGQVVRVEHDALLVALHVADRGTPDLGTGGRLRTPRGGVPSTRAPALRPPRGSRPVPRARPARPGQGHPPDRRALRGVHPAVALRDTGHGVPRGLARRLAARRRPGLRARARRAPAGAARPAGQQPGGQPAQPHRQPARGVDVLRARDRRDAAGLRDDDALARRRPRHRLHRVRPGAAVGAGAAGGAGLLPVLEVGDALGAVGPGAAGGAVGVPAVLAGAARPLPRTRRSRTRPPCADLATEL